MQVLDHGFVKFVDSMPAAPQSWEDTEGWGPGDARIVEAARLSVGGQRPLRDDKKLLTYLYRNKHTSPFEKVRFEFDVQLPIFVARQWIRHRMGSFNEMSARYSELPDVFYVPTPDRVRGQHDTNKQGSGAPLQPILAENAIETINAAHALAYQDYRHLLSLGVARELARMVLPVSIYTRWYWTVDLHNLLHFLRLRLDAHAQWEIQQYGLAIVQLIKPIVPFTVTLFEEIAP